jgi:hypothetical protein
MKRISVILFSFLLTVCYAQIQAGNSERNQLKGFVVKATIINGDTVPLINLKEAVIIEQMVFASEEDAKKYRHLVRDVRRVYPYAVLIGAKVKEYDHQMASMSRKEKREFMKKIEPEFKNQFEKVFRNNTVDQAQVLIKLINRETGTSSHYLIKQFKGSWNAFMWQSIALVVGTNLKDQYDPEGDDKAIEHIVQEIQSGVI